MYLTDEKVTVLGAAGAIGSNVVQTLLASKTAGRIMMYDPFEQGLEGTAEEVYHCAFPGADVTWSTDIGEALTDSAYIITSGGAPRKEGMTREDLRRDNARIAEQLGQDIKQHCPSCGFVIIIFNPADITGLTTLLHSGLEPGRVSTLAALDSTRLQTALSQHFGVLQDAVTGCRTYGGHGEQMAVFKGGIQVDGVSLDAILGGEKVNSVGMSSDQWADVQERVRGGGLRIIQLRGRSSFQSPSQQSVFMLRGVLGEPYEWPCGAYVSGEGFDHIMMAMPATLSSSGVAWSMPDGAPEDLQSLRDSYEHLIALRDQTIEDGILPPVSEWKQSNPHLT
ncbi:MAG: malate dehydrogenase [Candidatus Latescibacteria bacterium]|jgi:malate dehydrogenase|nr:malate dehydrogenase [Candidatus Latescibacterota bacterium]